jgi:hypothetical protein
VRVCCQVARLWELRLSRRAVTGSSFASGASRMAGTRARRAVKRRGFGSRRCISQLLRFVKPLQSGRLRWLHHTHCRPPLVAEVRHRPAARPSGSLLRGENFQRIAVVGSVYLGHLGIRHATKDASTRASAGMPPAIADLMRPPVLCLGRSSPVLHSASQSQKSCRTTPPAWSARRNTCQSRSASLDIRYLPCLLIWHSKSLLRRSCHRQVPA